MVRNRKLPPRWGVQRLAEASPLAMIAGAQIHPPVTHPRTPPPLNADFLAMMVRGVSVIVSASDAGLVPSVMRAVGSQVSASGDHITVFLNRSQSVQLLRNVATTDRLAVVFSEPGTHRTLQLKARGVRIREAAQSDVPTLERYLDSMKVELGRVGIGPPLVAAMLAHRLDDVVALEFTPEEAFDQTPGPRAGQPISGAP